MASDSDAPHEAPRYIIDLSLPPRDRYKTVATDFINEVKDLTGLFDNLLRDLAIPESWLPTVNRVSKLLLRKVHDSVQTEELRGISDHAGVPMYLLVAFNVVLDLLMGCTSGGVNTLEKGRPISEAKMLHFRTLDWTMDPLRKVIVQLDFVKSASKEPRKVLASSITYVGFVGVLTGVRPSLSMSLNFRAVHDAASRTAQFRFYFHHLLVLLGRRPSIASTLRSYLIGDFEGTRKGKRGSRGLEGGPIPLDEIVEDIKPKHTTAAYLIFSDGNTTISVDKDYGTGQIRSSKYFVATTNHDVLGDSQMLMPTMSENAAFKAVRNAAGLEDLLEESRDRLDCIVKRWGSRVSRERREQSRKGNAMSLNQAASVTTLTKKLLIGWVSAWPTTNECTHFSAVMDPAEGQVVWSVVYPIPIEAPT